ncbi:hypothetical protein [Burkholderia pseudomultivorans]|uniref:Uncharacterized protein n=1 Tax=Burkholderia pseudomultivorans TaxID=1207504 RepID=A0A132ECE2_9BURK|nr:hypothetical protein [Burkholderia pseudomultivorans]KWF24980.1 hypothetical protein WT56_22070 [Burkholderia pseudomultivorans]
MKFIEDGNFKEWVRVALIIIGLPLVIFSVRSGLKDILSIMIFCVGIVVASIGGYASQAHMFKIKPFDTHFEKMRAKKNKSQDGRRNDEEF